jgi:hypothetical protein
LATGATKVTFQEMMEAIVDNIDDVMTSDEDDDNKEDDEGDIDDSELSDDNENEHECNWVVGTINQWVQQHLHAFQAKRMKLAELTASSWEDAEDYFRECDKKYETRELTVWAISIPHDISTAVEATEEITFSQFVDGLNQPSTSGKIPSHSRSYLRLGSKKVLADQNRDYILPVDSPEKL